MTEQRSRSGGATTLVRKLWQYCNVLRDDGLSYPDYVEQLTYLLFLKMSAEKQGGPVPPQFGWTSLVALDAQEMQRHYGTILAALGERSGMLGLIFRNARNKIRDPAKLRLLVVDLIGQTEWTGLTDDLKGDAYEGLLEKNARDTKSGAGQYFTPRPLIEAIVECVDPRPGEIVCDPACGTAGFLLAAHRHIVDRNPDLTEDEQRHLRTRAIRGVELVEEVARLATMNLLLHGVTGRTDDELPILCGDSLRERPRTQFDVILTNPPFGVKGSVTYASSERVSGKGPESLTVVRPDFWVETANKQLNFLQHVNGLLSPRGRAAVVIPDNVLFEGGAAEIIRRRLLEVHDVHTLLRLPTGLFYAQSVKANVLFFDKKVDGLPSTQESPLWIYDLRSDNHFSLKTKPIRRADLVEFLNLYKPFDRTTRCSSAETATRWRSFNKRQILASENCSFDLMRQAEEAPKQSTGLERLEELSRMISSDLTHALAHIASVSTKL